MNKDKVKALITGYKNSSAFIAAYEMGIFDFLYTNYFEIEELSKALKLDQNNLLLLLLNLQSNGLVCCQEGRWLLSDTVTNSYEYITSLKDIIKHEKNIFDKCMSPKQIEQALKKGDKGRTFEKSGFSEEELTTYNNTMYGNNLKLIVLWLIRELRKYELPNILEYGRSGTNILESLDRTSENFNGYYCLTSKSTFSHSNVEDKFINYEAHKKDVKFDVVIMYNTVHYLKHNEIQSICKYLEKICNQEVIICIIDLFYDSSASFTSGIAIDWITHGGTSFITKTSVIEEFEQNNFYLYKKIDMKENNTSILIEKIKPEKM